MRFYYYSASLSGACLGPRYELCVVNWKHLMTRLIRRISLHNHIHSLASQYHGRSPIYFGSQDLSFSPKSLIRLAICTHVSSHLHHSRCDFHPRSNSQTSPGTRHFMLVAAPLSTFIDIPKCLEHGLTIIGCSSSRVLCGCILSTCFVMTCRLLSSA